MAIANFIPELWSRQLLWNLRKILIIEPLTNKNYQGEIGGLGDTLHIQTPGAIAVNAYTPRTTDITYETPTSTTQSLVIDQDQYFAFSVDDLEEVQSNVNLVSTFSEEAAYAVADMLDQDAAGLYTDFTHSVALDISSGTGSVDNVRPALIDAGVLLDQSNVPTGGRWAVLSATTAGAVRSAYGDRMTQLGDRVVTGQGQNTGYIGTLEGFDLYMSNNIVVATQHKNIFGHSMGWTFAYDLNMMEALRRESRFEDGVRGRVVWGRKVTRPTALGIIDTTV